MTFRFGCAFLVALSSMCTAQPPSDCKPIERYGVKGCEIRPDRTCPAGYHQQAVNPPDRRMAGPTYLMCVPDKQSQDSQSPREDKQKQEKQEPPNSNR